MKTSTWETLRLFDKTINGSNIRFIDSPLTMPDGVRDIIRKNWDTQLLKKQQSLKEQGIETELRSYHLDTSKDPNFGTPQQDPSKWKLSVIDERGEGKIIHKTSWQFDPNEGLVTYHDEFKNKYRTYDIKTSKISSRLQNKSNEQ